MKYTVIKIAVGVLFVAGYVALFCTPLGQPLERFDHLSSLYVLVACIVSVGVSLLLNRIARKRGEPPAVSVHLTANPRGICRGDFDNVQ